MIEMNDMNEKNEISKKDLACRLTYKRAFRE